MSQWLESLQRLQSPSGHFLPIWYCSSYGMGSVHRHAQSPPTHPIWELAAEDITSWPGIPSGMRQSRDLVWCPLSGLAWILPLSQSLCLEALKMLWLIPVPGASSLLLGLRQVFQDPGRLFWCASPLSCMYAIRKMLAARLHCEVKIPEVCDMFGESTSARQKADTWISSGIKGGIIN